MNLDDLDFYLEENLARVKKLLEIYQQLGIDGNLNAADDILRATIVLLHATLEDFLRSLMKIYLPNANSDVLSKIPLYLSENEFQKITKFHIGDLAKHKDKSIEKLINLSVEQYLDRISYNDTNEIINALKQIDIKLSEKATNLLPSINKMIKRRHNIVHQADRVKSNDEGFRKAKIIKFKQVEDWINDIDEFITEINKNY